MELPAVELRPVRRADFPLVCRWLADPLVARWWDDDSSPDAVEAHYGPAVDGADTTAVYLGMHEGRVFGLVQVYRFDDEPESLAELSTVCPVPPGALSIDYLVGEPDARGRGLGAGMIAAAVARGFADHPDAGEVLVPVVAANEASWRALERAGGVRYATGELTPDNPVDSREHVVHRFARPQGGGASLPGRRTSTAGSRRRRTAG
ncbi:GNAT family N-acetyltransferase [Blastococcus goldschmidtiae]|uniref:Lysine N-acyltransferase MbtK n=1 Tax=Blastococcus goldschmidtiae TaxID=3075546 RepID=A0ABU2KAQ8_9ACTN|nr:GNAT family N-acetyltransferase [Blastococcus sp. DSM 46792]MDT0277279.1 GNAT family N-acetyltransferase [Blastococcus sp. DSM 46792]